MPDAASTVSFATSLDEFDDDMSVSRAVHAAERSLSNARIQMADTIERARAARARARSITGFTRLVAKASATEEERGEYQPVPERKPRTWHEVTGGSLPQLAAPDGGEHKELINFSISLIEKFGLAAS